MTMMRSARVDRFGARLQIAQVPVPVPQPGQVLVKVSACGICHTDLHAIRGEWADQPDLPLVPGHEAVGIVAAVGEDGCGVEVGDRVGVPWLHWTCGRCEACLSGWETLCPRQRRTGYDVDGGFAEYVIADGRHVAHLPDQIDFVHAAPLICAGLTVYKGLRMTEATPGEWVVVSGVGGLGHLAVQYARAMGFRVVACDVDESKLDLAKQLGADMTINVRSTDPTGYLQRTIGGAHGALVTAVSPAAFGQAVGMVRAGGTVVLNGIPPGDFSLNIFDVVMRAITVRGSIVGTRHDLAQALGLAAQSGIRPTVHEVAFADLPDAVERLEHWPVPGRMVVRMEQS